MIFIAIVSVPLIISAAISTKFSLLSAWMFIIASKKTDFEKIIRIAYKILCIMIPLVIILHFMGIIDDRITMRGGMLRHSMGFAHPNQFGLRLFQFIACHLYIHRNMLKLYDFFIAIVIMFIAYYIPNSQTSYICIFLLILLLLVLKICQRYNQTILELYGKILLFFATAFNFFSVCWSLIDVKKNRILQQIDLGLSLRFSSCYKVFHLYGISVLGQRIYASEEDRKMVGMTGKLYLDNGYVTLLLRYGVIAYGIFSACYLFAMWYFKSRNQYFLFVILFVYALYGIMENGIYMVTHNIFLISFTSIITARLVETTVHGE